MDLIERTHSELERQHAMSRWRTIDLTDAGVSVPLTQWRPYQNTNSAMWLLYRVS